MTTFPTTVAGYPARIEHGPAGYTTLVAIDGHWRATIVDPANGTRVRWHTTYYTPTGWHLDPGGHGTAPTMPLAVAAVQAWWHSDDLDEVGCRYCGSSDHHDEQCTA